MPIHEIIKLNSSRDERLRLSVMLALNCAPILKGSKAACIVTVKPHEFFIIRDMFKNTGVLYRLLKTGKNHSILYLYRENQLYKYLCQAGVREFLKKYGYFGVSLEEMLDRLSDRILLYGNGKIEFPHEIGIFLGYPIADVKGFIENEGKNFIYSGYWKVYENVAEAVQLFRQYDMEREMAVREVIRGLSIREVVGSLTHCCLKFPLYDSPSVGRRYFGKGDINYLYKT